ncbi:MAG: glucose-1-phosphate thymidylyltransferase RfbA [candidate division Zixibacteria bacterium]|nr:glucose-1-phosphate thymidylyltransferase RfbA [candidate division Zixibacteria bacterium]
MGYETVKKGIILAGGNGSRLFPITQIISKQLLPIYDKPMIYYPLSTLMLIGIREILLISTPKDLPQFKNLFGDGSQLGLKISYAVQEKAEGIAQALIIGEDFIGEDNVTLILGDNIFYGDYRFLKKSRNFESGARIFSYYINNPERYGVLEFDNDGNAVSIEEKPDVPKSNYVVTGLYMFDNSAPKFARQLKPSVRGELEISDVNKKYMAINRLKVVKLGRGLAWLDTGTTESMLAASNFIATIEKRQGLKVACLEEIAYRMKFIDKSQINKLAENMTNNSYREYLLDVIKEVDGER